MDSKENIGRLVVKLGPITHNWISNVTLNENEIIAKNTTEYPLKFMNTSKVN
jgi:ribosome-associated toxin RatA of RatAB toxin-antitoxin module